MKTLIEQSLASEFVLPAVDEFVAGCESRIRHRIWPKRVERSLLKRALIIAAACLAVVLLTGYISGRIYFRKTFSYQLSSMVIRCSDGIERKSPDGKWEKLRVGDRLRNGTVLRTPAGAQSFISFDGIRLLTEGEARIEAEGVRRLSLKEGALFVATAERKKPASITSAKVVVQSSGGVFGIDRSTDATTIAVAAGHVKLTSPDGKTHKLAENQVATLRDRTSAFELASAKVLDPFARNRETVIERIKQRFARVISSYMPNYQFTRRMMNRLDGSAILGMWTRPNGMFQFASHTSAAPLRYAQADMRAISEYYESLFVPSNRSISIGKEKAVPLDPGTGASFPRWSSDGSMIAFIQTHPMALTGIARVVRVDDLDNPWDISQEWSNSVRSMFPLTWAPDDQHVLFQVETGQMWDDHGPTDNVKIKIAPIDPGEGPLVDFDSPFHDIPLPLPLPVGKTISPGIAKLPYGDAMVCSNWGNLAFIPVESDGQAVPAVPGLFLTNFNPREMFVMGGGLSPSGSYADFTGVADLNFSQMGAYILYEVEDIIDGFTQPPRSLNDPRIKRIAPSTNMQFTGGFSFDESLVFFHEDVNHAFNAFYPTYIYPCDFDVFYANALSGEPGKPTQIHLPGNQMFMQPSPEGNRLAYSNLDGDSLELRVVSFDIEADIDADLGGVLIDNSGTNLIVPPGAFERNLKVKISTPFSIGEEAEMPEGESRFFAMRLLDAQGLEKPKFIEPMTLTIRYTDDEVAGLDEGMLEIYYYDDTDAANPKWIPLGGTVDPEHNEIAVEIRHFSKFSVGEKRIRNTNGTN
jgi:hypothetical protein